MIVPDRPKNLLASATSYPMRNVLAMAPHRWNDLIGPLPAAASSAPRLRLLVCGLPRARPPEGRPHGASPAQGAAPASWSCCGLSHTCAAHTHAARRGE